MAIINRLSRLIRADFHGVLDNLEEPQLQLKQSIREMQDALALARQQAQMLESRINDQQKQLADVRNSIEKIGQELDLWFDSNEDELARKLIRRKLELQQLEQCLQTRTDRDQAQWQNQQERLENYRTTLAGLQQKAELYKQPQSPAVTNCPSVEGMPRLEVTQEDIEVAFLGEKKRRSSL